MILNKNIIVKLKTVLSLTFILVGSGTFGYMVIEDYSFIQGLYMTVITVSTVGFGEVKPLGVHGQLFTIILIFSSLGIVSYVLSIITDIIGEGDIVKRIRNRQMNKEISKLKNHIIICGFGRNGRQAAKKLNLYNRNFVIIEQDAEKVKNDSSLSDVIVIEGDATRDKVLVAAGIESASALITVLPADTDNLFVVLSARQLNKNLKIISRASMHTSVKKLKIAGANNVIMPDKIGGEHMASLIVTPDILEFLDNLSIEGSYAFNLVEVAVKNLPQHLIGKTIRDIDLRRKTGCTVIGCKTSDQNYIINPDPNMLLEKKSKLIILGQPNQIEDLRNIYHVEIEKNS